jgi:hypothetical protein|tara:strand:+ start:342 stop:713 length:372 start_codon:yes stop_codon:yes gene_type:complete
MTIYLFTNLNKQLYLRDKHMNKFIDMQIEEYLKSDSTKDFESEYIWNDSCQILLSITELNELCNNQKEYEIELKELKKSFRDFGNKWFGCDKDSKGNFVDGTSKFMKLVKERMKELNFEQRVS